MEIKKEDKVENLKSNLMLESRKRMSLTGVLEVIRFSDEEIMLNTVLGALNIKGEELKMHKLDIQQGEVMITGSIDSCIYSTNKSKTKKNDTILARLFK